MERAHGFAPGVRFRLGLDFGECRVRRTPEVPAPPEQFAYSANYAPMFATVKNSASAAASIATNAAMHARTRRALM
jgi:hypothetical protein